ncbi:hypothetical protein AVEN_50307-1 [Araneus ventricosus]|uniref:Uncharacterized protein n=1 Tax=Araneus ventricosus TaxID=182803 RepID=A0A4Y2RUV4_ARAVE|nr:hypothetical protein AVEN_50307-1 [Araneus ventricosus]
MSSICAEHGTAKQAVSDIKKVERDIHIFLLKSNESIVSSLMFLLSRIGSTQRESIVIVKKFKLEILTNLHVLDLPESEKHNFGIMSVSEHDNSKTIRATGMKYGM